MFTRMMRVQVSWTTNVINALSWWLNKKPSDQIWSSINSMKLTCSKVTLTFSLLCPSLEASQSKIVLAKCFVFRKLIF